MDTVTWHTVNITLKTISGIFNKSIPENRNIKDGKIDNDITLKSDLLFQVAINITAYNNTKIALTITYVKNALSNQKLK